MRLEKVKEGLKDLGVVVLIVNMMKQELKDLLLEYYGELLGEHEYSNDYFIKVKISDKINAINLLLNLPKQEKDNRPFCRNLHSITKKLTNNESK